jgi:hypothetical protein
MSTSFEPAIVVNSRFRTELVWNVDLDLTSVDLDIRRDLVEGTLPGRWHLTAAREGPDAVTLVHYAELAAGAMGKKVTVTFDFSWVDGDEEGQITKERWDQSPFPAISPDTHRVFGSNRCPIQAKRWRNAASASDGRYDPHFHRSYRSRVVFEQAFPREEEKPLEEEEDEQALELALRVSSTLHSHK